MRYTIESIIVIVTFLSIVFLLCGCSSDQKQISVNNYVQTNYDYQCLDDSKTFTQIITCYQLQDKAEKEQNCLTNEMILKDSKIK